MRTVDRFPLPPDDHVHSQFSYDAKPGASMERACEQAIRLGLPSVAFTEHLDLVTPMAGDALSARGLVREPYVSWAPLDVESYLASIAQCRERFRELRIKSGAEIGEAHLFAASLSGVLAGGAFDRVLGSVHAVPHGEQLVEVDTLFGQVETREVLQRYFAAVLQLVQSDADFQVLAHVDYARRYQPADAPVYDESAYEQEYRGIFRALADSGRALEINTKSPLASVRQIGWWREDGGRWLTFASDAHVPWLVGHDFARAAAVASAAGLARGVRRRTSGDGEPSDRARRALVRCRQRDGQRPKGDRQCGEIGGRSGEDLPERRARPRE